MDGWRSSRARFRRCRIVVVVVEGEDVGVGVQEGECAVRRLRRGHSEKKSDELSDRCRRQEGEEGREIKFARDVLLLSLLPPSSALLACDLATMASLTPHEFASSFGFAPGIDGPAASGSLSESESKRLLVEVSFLFPRSFPPSGHAMVLTSIIHPLIQFYARDDSFRVS